MAMPNKDNEKNCCILEANENVAPGTRSRNETLHYWLAVARNRLYGEYQEKYEKARIEKYIKEDAATKQHRSIHMALKMSEIAFNIQGVPYSSQHTFPCPFVTISSLHSGIERDLPKTIECLKKLLKEPFTTMSLLYAPCMVKIVYLCCKYTKSSEIRELAEKCYKRFRPCFGVPYGETFEAVFQSAVRKFWEKQEQNSDGTKYDHRQFTMNDDISTEVGNMVTENNEGIEIGFYADDKNLVIQDVEIDGSQCFKRESTEETEMEVTPDTKSPMEETAVEVKAECENETEKSHHDCCNITIKQEIKQEIVDSGEVETSDCILKPERITDMLEISVKSEPIDCDNLSAEYELDKGEVSSFKLESISGMPELCVKLEPIDFEALNILYDNEKHCYILNSL